MSDQAAEWMPSFSDRVMQLLDRVDYRLAETPDEKETIYRLRYEAYLREGAIVADFGRRLADRFDDAENAWTFGLFLEDRLVSSLRIHIASPSHPDTPAVDAFPDVLGPELDAGKTIVDPNRFVIDHESARRHPELPYVSLRLAYLACMYFDADLGTATVRTEHQAFYRRVFAHQVAAPARPYPTLTKPLSLMTVPCRPLKEHVLRRYPFFWSTLFERRMLFERRQRASGNGLSMSGERSLRIAKTALAMA